MDTFWGIERGGSGGSGGCYGLKDALESRRGAEWVDAWDFGCVFCIRGMSVALGSSVEY